MSNDLNLDDRSRMLEIDRDNMLGHIDALPTQFQNAWHHAQTLPLPDSHRQPRLIVLCGMGGSAIGGDLTAALISRSSAVPFIVIRGYDLPAFVAGPDTLVIASSFSGNTEETIAAVHEAETRGVRLLAITTGGQLADYARQHGHPLWLFDYKSQPRAALGWSFGLLIGLVHRLGLAPSLESDLAEGVALLTAQRALYGAESPLATNPAKRGAGQLIGRIPVFWGGGFFAPIAQRWKGQLNENAKVWAQWEPMPEANHNAVVGIGFPAEQMIKMTAVFIMSPTLDHPRVLLRHELTLKMCLQNGIMTDTFKPQGTSALAQMMHAIQYGDYLSYYAAIAYGADPTEIAPIIELKEQLAAHS